MGVSYEVGVSNHGHKPQTENKKQEAFRWRRLARNVAGGYILSLVVYMTSIHNGVCPMNALLSDCNEGHSQSTYAMVTRQVSSPTKRRQRDGMTPKYCCKRQEAAKQVRRR